MSTSVHRAPIVIAPTDRTSQRSPIGMCRTFLPHRTRLLRFSCADSSRVAPDPAAPPSVGSSIGRGATQDSRIRCTREKS